MDEQALNELLECSVCLERLDHTSKVLPCQHTFCRRCLDEIVSTKHELRCPECRSLVTCSVDNLPTNILLVRLLEGLKTQGLVPGRGSATHTPGRKQDSAALSPVVSRSARQTSSVSRPCAKALFNYESRDPGDLTFKKGDMVYLKKEVDENWYYGELGSHQGFFPATYVQVVTSLPDTTPKCKGLYDFDMEFDEDGDCLSFKKDEMLTVIKKVDDNWLEGKKGEKIGIFPKNFVELNETAKALVEAQTSAQPTPSVGSQDVREGDASVPPNTRLPSSTSVPYPLPYPLPYSQNKRHSYTGSPHHRSPQTQRQRRSLEISSDSDLSLHAGNGEPVGVLGGPPVTASVTVSGAQFSSGGILVNAIGAQVTVSGAQSCSGGAPVTGSAVPAAAPGSSDVVQTSSQFGSPSLDSRNGQKQTENRHAVKPSSADNSGKKSHRPVPPLPKSGDVVTGSPGKGVPVTTSVDTTVSSGYSVPLYVAMYNYKPQKRDEIELRKGDYYGVTEKCQDGWFKGHCHRTGLLGVFPGNYVQIVRSQSAFKMSGRNGAGRNGKNQGQVDPKFSPNLQVPPRPQTSSGRSHSTDMETAPPIVPRNSKTSSSSGLLFRGAAVSSIPSSSSQSAVLLPGKSTHTSMSKSHTSNSASSKSSSHQTSPLSKSGSKSVGKSDIRTSPLAQGSSGGDRAAPTPSSGSSSSPVWKHAMSASASVTPPNVVVGASGETTPSSTPGAKDKKEKKDKERLSLLMKRLTTGKSKKSKQPSSESEGASNDTGVTHVRSGSFPSDTTVGAVADSGQHKKSGSFDASSTNSPPQKPSRPKPLVREKFRCVVPYPPQSEIELELKIGDIVYVHKKRDDGWFKGTLQRTGKTGLFPGSFAEKCD